MKALMERLEFIRNYLAGEHSNKKTAMDRMIECLAIAEALPEFQLIPSQPPARDRSIPQRVTFAESDQIELFDAGETIKIENPADPSQFIYIQKLGARLAEPPPGEDTPEIK